MIFKHVSGSIVEINKNDVRRSVYESSPSWKQIEFKESDTTEGLYSSMSRDELLKLARLRSVGVSDRHTKDELIERLQKRDVVFEEIEHSFTDNLVIE